MKGVKLGLLGVCFGIMGLASATNNAVAIGVAFLGIVAAVAGICVKD